MERIAVVDFVHLTITYEEEPNMKVATDIGGTFTDLVAIDENGSPHQRKRLADSGKGTYHTAEF